LSKLRHKWERSDLRNASILLFARQYYGQKFRFLTLTTSSIECRTLRNRKHLLFKTLRSNPRYSDIQYRCTNTDEGNGVAHMCIISKNYIPWKLLSDVWGSRTWINLEKDLTKLVFEMSLQNNHAGYSMSRGFLPKGSLQAIDSLSLYFRGSLGRKAVKMLANRLRGSGDLDQSLYRTQECCRRKDGMCSDIRSKIVYYGGRNLHD
jgi:hypothetical protein